MKKTVLCCMMISAASLLLLGGCGKTEPAPPTQPPADTAPPISFEATDMDGNTVSAELFSQSELTMVNVWATYCDPCLREMPGLGELAGEYADDGFQIVGVISDVPEGSRQEALDLAAELIEQTGADYPHLLLSESLYYALLTDVTAVPTTFFIDREGTVLNTVVGAMEKSAWEEQIDGLLEKE